MLKLITLCLVVALLSGCEVRTKAMTQEGFEGCVSTILSWGTTVVRCPNSRTETETPGGPPGYVPQRSTVIEDGEVK